MFLTQNRGQFRLGNRQQRANRLRLDPQTLGHQPVGHPSLPQSQRQRMRWWKPSQRLNASVGSC